MSGRGIANPFKLAGPGGDLSAWRLDRLLEHAGLTGPIPTRIRAHRFALELLLDRLEAPRSAISPADQLFGITVSMDNALELDEVRIAMSDGTERAYRLSPA